MPDTNKVETAIPKTIYLKDYQPPAWWVDTVDLQFILDSQATEITSTLTIRRNSDTKKQVLKLDCEKLNLKTISLNGQLLDESRYQLTDYSLILENIPDKCEITSVVEINPTCNTSLMGLYQSGGNFCTQCEAEGFRRITFFPDRPDILAIYTVTILADKVKYPVLLSNGNPQRFGGTEPDSKGNARHYAVWHDPHPKPSYLFALVAGNLACIHDEFTTMSGKHVDLNIYVEPYNADKCDHAMRSIINAMRWDEQTYGREYDLDVFNVVAVDDFNMGAMENKGLNIFNSKYILALPDTATDTDYQGIEGVVGHEYFHNWSGNRVTCRDWFQLSLKEGFTVFRDQEFSADMSSRGIKRIQDVNMLRSHQFREDAGPIAHPVRPDRYVEINNFYTLTVYSKGAEIIRMIYSLLGSKKFRQGTDLYFSRYDSQAVTTDEFIQAMEDVSGYDLKQFRLWYSTAGTPELTSTENYDAGSQEYTLSIEQKIPDTPGQADKAAMHIPFRMGLLSAKGEAIPLTLKNEENSSSDICRVLHLKQKTETFIFTNISEKPIASLLRSFSAPVKLKMERSIDELCFLIVNDKDEFNRWDAAQNLATRLMISQLSSDSIEVEPAFIEALGKILTNKNLKPALVAEIFRLPMEGFLADQRPSAEPDRIHQVRKAFHITIAARLYDELLSQYNALTQPGDYSIEPDRIGQRTLRNTCLGYLMSPSRDQISDEVMSACIKQFRQGNNMTDVIAALACLCNVKDPIRESSLNSFYDRWRNDTLVMDKWLSLQATSELPDTLDRVKALTRHSAFNIKNPNKVRSLVGAFANSNPQHFHAENGSGYEFIANQIIKLDQLNPQIAARMTHAFSRWKQYNKSRQTLMKKQLKRILDIKGLSKDVFEIAYRSLSA